MAPGDCERKIRRRKKETKTSDNLSSSIVGRIIEKHLPKCNNKCISIKITVERFHQKQYNIIFIFFFAVEKYRSQKCILLEMPGRSSTKKLIVWIPCLLIYISFFLLANFVFCSVWQSMSAFFCCCRADDKEPHDTMVAMEKLFIYFISFRWIFFFFIFSVAFTLLCRCLFLLLYFLIEKLVFATQNLFPPKIYCKDI